jgi:hypothetical protein
MRIARSRSRNPLAPLGGRETGSMNVYVLELYANWRGSGTKSTSSRDWMANCLGWNRSRRTSAWCASKPGLPRRSRRKRRPPAEFHRNIKLFAEEQPAADVIHSHYWQSGWAGTLARELDRRTS